MLLQLLDRLPAADQQTPDGLILQTDPAKQFSFRIWAGSQRPDTVPGHSDAVRSGEVWRIFTTTDGKGQHVEVAVRQDVRAGFASRVASHLLHPLWIAVPLLAVLIWAAVRWGLLPLDKLAAGVAQRSPSQLQPLPQGKVPAEILPLVSSLNDLFARIAASRERDRRFAADAAHELRTPLAAIKTYAQIAEQAKDLDSCRQAVSGVLAGADRSTRVVEQLLALARIDNAAAAAAFTPVDLKAVARTTISELASKSATRNIELGLSDGNDEVLEVDGNADLLAVLSRNLVHNALNYTPAGGNVSVAVEPAGDAVILRVDDSGPGLPPELRTRVLDRFFRVAGTGVAGSGLGLSIVAAIAEVHGATLELGDRPGSQGLSVQVKFPLATCRRR
jgi:two-component system sensor histidine kinase QseC